MLEKVSRFFGRVANFFKRAGKLVLALTGNKYYRKKLVNILTGKGKDSEIDSADILKRKELFQDFYRDFFGNIIHSTYSETLSADSSQFDGYDYVIAGSDQVWNPELVGTFEALRYFYLEFVEKEKRVNYAPSFGVSRLKFLERHVHREGLNGFTRLSCREKEGCDLIRELTGRDAQLVLDPTFLLTAEQWRKIERKPEYEVPEHYALTYFLGEAEMSTAKKLAGELPIIQAPDGTAQIYSMTGPREFVWLIDHADLVITASFHGTAFSVNFGRRFITFKGGNWFSRMKTLLSNLGLTDRIFELGRDDDRNNIADMPIDYEAVNVKLAELRKKSMNYLASCLGK